MTHQDTITERFTKSGGGQHPGIRSPRHKRGGFLWLKRWEGPTTSDMSVVPPGPVITVNVTGH